MDKKPILITCLVLLLTACLMLSCASMVGAGIWLMNVNTSAGFEEPISLATPQDDTVDTPSLEPAGDSAETEALSNPEEAPSNSTSPETALDPAITRQMDEIQMQVILERGLKPSDTVDRQLYSSEQLRQKVLDDFAADYSPAEAQTDALTLAAFGLLDPDFDLYTFYIDLLSEQIAGFYDQETKEMVVVQGEGFGGTERLTYAHEYVHALQDQTYDIENGLNFNDEACEADSERCAALQALIEGDASLTELNWFFANATSQDQADIMEFYSQLDTPVYDSAPQFISLDFIFPYETGLNFVQYLYDNGGWGAVDRAYQDVPLSTEQILHPERYPDDKPIPVELPDLSEILGEGWEEFDRGVMGEWYTYLILAKGREESARLGESQAGDAAEGWGGDAYAVYYHEETQATVMVLLTTWDTPGDADEFADAFRDYANDRFGNASDDQWRGADGDHRFYQVVDTTAWILAPETETIDLIWQALDLK